MVRVVRVADRMWVGWVVALAGGLAFYLTAGFQWEILNRYLQVGIALSLWNLGPLLAGRPAPRLTSLAGAAALVPNDVERHVAIARAERGYSVAVSWPDGALFFEVDSETEARALVRRIEPVSGRVQIRVRPNILRFAIAVVSVIGLVASIAYAIVVGVIDDDPFYRTLLGLPSIIAALLGSLLFVISQFMRHAVEVGSDATIGGAASAHLKAHERAQIDGRLRVDASISAESEIAEPRFRVLVRGAETAAEWLSRVDALGAAGEGYRGDAPTREELRAVVADANASFDMRLAAARVLVRRHEGDPAELASHVEDELVPYMFDVVREDAAAKLESRGPLFRAK